MGDQDRTVHGLTPNGGEIVRYDRAGKWYVERQGARARIGVGRAAQLAADGTAHLDLPGGQVFDARVRKLREEKR